MIPLQRLERWVEQNFPDELEAAREDARKRKYYVSVDGQRSPKRLDRETAELVKSCLEGFGHEVEILQAIFTT